MAEIHPFRETDRPDDSSIVEMIIRFLDSEMSEDELVSFNEILRSNDRARAMLVSMTTQETRMSELLFEDQSKETSQIGRKKPEHVEHLQVSPPTLLMDNSGTATTPSNVAFPSLFGGNSIASFFSSNRGILLTVGGFIALLVIVGFYRRGTDARPSNEVMHAPRQDLVGMGPLEVRTIKTNSGSTKFTLANIGYVITDGPTELEMVGPMHAKLHQGRIKVRVTEKSGEGFVVETPDGKVTDLGTEFVLDVASEGKSTLAVTEGKVNLQIAQNGRDLQDSPTELLVQGDGVNFKKGLEAERIMSIVRGDQTETFQFVSDTISPSNLQSSAVIIKVTDNLRKSDTKKFYEIVPRGLKEDALGFVDRPHQWNGVTEEGMPKYLVGADYVKTFGQDSWRKDIEISVTVGRPAKLYLFVDDRQQEWEWLKKDFRKMKEKIGADTGPWGKRTNAKLRVGPGKSVDHTHNIWECIVREPGTIKLGPPHMTGIKQTSQGMYGIAAIPLTTDDP